MMMRITVKAPAPAPPATIEARNFEAEEFEEG
jgi:hypothetical protein